MLRRGSADLGRGRSGTADDACVAEGVSKVYGGRDTAVRALRDVTLRIPCGEFTAIMGPSGSGKSTLLHCLAALDTPTSGRVFLRGTELTALSRRQQAQVRRDRIGFVFQAFNLVPTLDAIENITLPQLLAGRRPDQQWLDFVVSRTGLSDRLHHRPKELSGGQQQRVALARALAGRPEVIFADEPTGNLDTTASAEMLMLLRDAVDQFKQTVVTVTHDPTIAAHADRILFLTDGRVVDELDRPDVDHVLARLRRLNDVGGASGGGREPEPTDGQDSMRSRRRRQPDDKAPGRPMVGSDDEVEVARQERWLARIRQQFEAEAQPAADFTAVTQPHDGWTGVPAIERDEPLRPPAAPLDHTASPPERADGPPDGGVSSGTVALDRLDSGRPTARAVDNDAAGNWLPPERSWAELGGNDRDATPPWTETRDSQPAAHPDNHDTTPPWTETRDATPPWTETRDSQPAAHPDDHDTAPSETVPWSRPEAEQWPEGDATQPPDERAQEAASDPWTPPDRSSAEEYHNGAGPGRRSRGWRAPGDDVWTTSPPQSAQPGAHTGGLEAPGSSQPPAAGSATYDRWQPADPGEAHAPDAHRNGRHPGGAPNGSGAQHMNGHDEPLPPTPPSGHERGDDTAPWTRSPQGEHRDHDWRDETRDPWSEVWDTDDPHDAGEVWTPAFESSPPASGTAADDQVATPDAPAPQTDGQRTPAPHPPAPQTDGQRTPAPHPPAPQNDGHPAPSRPQVEEPETARPSSPPEPQRQPVAAGSATAASVPPALASLRNPRRPDAPTEADPLEALQSLQAQLERLGAGRRPAGPGSSRPDPRTSGADTNRRERY